MQKQDQPNRQLTIFHFNDAYDIETNASGELGFINFYDYVNRMRMKHCDALLIFSGDAFAPSKLSRVLRGQQMAHCLKMLKIDVACYGNHDFDFDPTHSLKLAKSCGFPWLLGNIKYIDSKQNIGDGLNYFIMTHNNVKIGFLGLAGPDFNGRLISEYHKKLVYYDIAEYAKKICGKLLQQKCQLIIALTHARRNADEYLANQVPQIDIILGGHDHFSLFKIINKIPIVKSSSNFQCMSIVKINQLQQIKAGKQKDTFYGRRWNFESICHKIKPTQQKYPELQNYIKESVEKYKEYNRQKSLANNKKEQKIKMKMEQDQWLLSYGVINNRPTISLMAGLSAEICFAKYIAFKKNYFFAGYKKQAPQLTPNFVQQTLTFVQNIVKSFQNSGKTILYSPGICNVPYLVQIGNFIYLPSHFLVGVNSIKQLNTMLDIADEKGYKCYAVLGYDSFFGDRMCAWIKFIQPPQQYINIIQHFQVENIVIMSVHDTNGNNHGSQRYARLLAGENISQKRFEPLPQDVYLIFMKEQYDNLISKDAALFSKLIKDIDKNQWQQICKRPLCTFIHDWQSGIDCVKTLQVQFDNKLDGRKINYAFILHPDSWKLYLSAYYLGKQFILHNFVEQTHPVKPKGIVFNQYIMSNPSYELNYGYIPILYWQFYPKNQQRILKVLTQDQRKYKRWFNMHRGTKLQLMQHNSQKIATDHYGIELVRWITKHAPKVYNLKYMSIDLILKCLGQQGLLVQP